MFLKNTFHSHQIYTSDPFSHSYFFCRKDWLCGFWQFTTWHGLQADVNGMVSSRTTSWCTAGTCAITMHHLQEAFWGNSFLGHNWRYPIVLQFSSSIYHIRVTLISNPQHDLVLHSKVMMFSRGFSERKTFWGKKWFGGNYFLDQRVAQRGKWIATLSIKHNCDRLLLKSRMTLLLDDISTIGNNF